MHERAQSAARSHDTIVSQCDTGYGCHTCKICHICIKYNCHVSLVTKCVTGDFLELPCVTNMSKCHMMSQFF
jgi:hypothetical protein